MLRFVQTFKHRSAAETYKVHYFLKVFLVSWFVLNTHILDVSVQLLPLRRVWILVEYLVRVCLHGFEQVYLRVVQLVVVSDESFDIRQSHRHTCIQD
jgi:hypothetical protein